MPSALASRTADYRVTVKSERHHETFAMGLRSFAIEAKLLAHFAVRRIGVEEPAVVEATDAAGDKSKGTQRPVPAAPPANGKRPNA